MAYIRTKLNICTSDEQPCRNMRLLMQTEWYSPPGSHRRWLQFNC